MPQPIVRVAYRSSSRIYPRGSTSHATPPEKIAHPDGLLNPTSTMVVYSWTFWVVHVCGLWLQKPCRLLGVWSLNPEIWSIWTCRATLLITYHVTVLWYGCREILGGLISQSSAARRRTARSAGPRRRLHGRAKDDSRDLMAQGRKCVRDGPHLDNSRNHRLLA